MACAFGLRIHSKSYIGEGWEYVSENRSRVLNTITDYKRQGNLYGSQHKQQCTDGYDNAAEEGEVGGS